MREIAALAEGRDEVVHRTLRAGPPGIKYGTWATPNSRMETLMRWLAAALVLFAGIGAAQANIRVDELRYTDGKLIISGETAPDPVVTLDDKYTTKSDRHFTFTEHYKPYSCMSDVRDGDDVYFAAIVGCPGTGDINATLPADKAAKAPQ